LSNKSNLKNSQPQTNDGIDFGKFSIQPDHATPDKGLSKVERSNSRFDKLSVNGIPNPFMKICQGQVMS